jgi:hypothetical protein
VAKPASIALWVSASRLPSNRSPIAADISDPPSQLASPAKGFDDSVGVTTMLCVFSARFAAV